MAKFKEYLKDYFVYEGKECRYIRNEPERIRATSAKEGCLWLIYTSYNSRDCCYQIKTFENNHTCGRDFGSNLADRKWVASKLVKVLETRPDLTLKEAKDHMVEEYNVQLHDKIIARALKAARKQVIRKKGEQYGKIQDNLSELLRNNPCSTAMMWTIPQPESLALFDRLYISLEACKLRFKAGCRRLIGLDGCFLKGYYGGQLLSGIEQDGNNHFFIISYAVVDSENTETYK
ncbi:uncharacterized protein LOC130967081 [Arachis stenosperma]|uniref:uncharacterized protein LOC130967081 n=1 Tax=Arachis stenosperma TaxID=217475 RepID=UPI0025ABF391|nr:uncharacterized protein LOC130967081 [Arachis stenosperma]